jgi:hypothetical protein
MVADVQWAKEALASFLEVAVDRFPEDAGAKRVFGSFVPRTRFAHLLSQLATEHLLAWDMDWVMNLAIRAGISRERLFGVGGSLPPMEASTRQYLMGVYEEEIEELESLLEMDLDYWRR